MPNRLASSSKITLVSPDPNTRTNSRKYETVHNNSQTVTFTPNTIWGTAETVDAGQKNTRKKAAGGLDRIDDEL